MPTTPQPKRYRLIRNAPRGGFGTQMIARVVEVTNGQPVPFGAEEVPIDTPLTEEFAPHPVPSVPDNNEGGE